MHRIMRCPPGPKPSITYDGVSGLPSAAHLNQQKKPWWVWLRRWEQGQGLAPRHTPCLSLKNAHSQTLVQVVAGVEARAGVAYVPTARGRAVPAIPKNSVPSTANA